MRTLTKLDSWINFGDLEQCEWVCSEFINKGMPIPSQPYNAADQVKAYMERLPLNSATRDMMRSMGDRWRKKQSIESKAKKGIKQSNFFLHKSTKAELIKLANEVKLSISDTVESLIKSEYKDLKAVKDEAKKNKSNEISIKKSNLDHKQRKDFLGVISKKEHKLQLDELLETKKALSDCRTHLKSSLKNECLYAVKLQDAGIFEQKLSNALKGKSKDKYTEKIKKYGLDLN